MLKRKIEAGLGLSKTWYEYFRSRPASFWSDLRTWMRTAVLRRNLVEEGLPWLNFPALHWMDSWVTPDAAVFEWGSGASTVFLAERAREVVSVEHDPVWALTTAKALASHKLDNADLYVEIPEGSRGESSDSESWNRYVDVLLDYPDQHFDLIIVDGRSRMRCLQRASQVTRRAVLLDDSNRGRYADAEKFFPASEWQVLPFKGPVPGHLGPRAGESTVFIRSD